jgi:hypothetical protein
MTDQAPANMPIVAPVWVPPDPDYMRAAGMFVMNLSLRPRWKFGVHDGSRRRFGDRTPRPATATLISIAGGKR